MRLIFILTTLSFFLTSCLHKSTNYIRLSKESNIKIAKNKIEAKDAKEEYKALQESRK